MIELRVKDIMTKKPPMINPDASLRDAAAKMDTTYSSALPVGTKTRVIGIVTDRDIVVRAVAKNKIPAQEKVRNYMTPRPIFCRENDTIVQAVQVMKENGIGRLIVQNAGGDVTGLLSLNWLIQENASSEAIARALAMGARKTQRAA